MEDLKAGDYLISETHDQMVRIVRVYPNSYKTDWDYLIDKKTLEGRSKFDRYEFTRFEVPTKELLEAYKKNNERELLAKALKDAKDGVEGLNDQLDRLIKLQQSASDYVTCDFDSLVADVKSELEGIKSELAEGDQ
jgi:hypothetical protein